MEKQIQQQISEASLRLSNDSSQNKSIRRTHKQNYEAAQQKITSIDQNLNLMQKRQQHQHPKKVTQDDINLHKNNTRALKNNLLVQTGNSQTLNCNTSLMYMERRNSMKSISSNNTFIIHTSPGSSEAMSPLRTSQNALTTIRTRHDSFSNNNHIEPQQSPTLSHYSIQSHQLQQQIRYQKNMKIKPDQSYSPNHNPQYHHYHTHNQNYSGSPHESPQQQHLQNYIQRLHNTNYQYSNQMQHHPQQMAMSPSQIHYAQDLLLTTTVHPNNSHHQYQSHRISQSHNYSDDMKENNHQQLLLQHQIRLQKIANQQQQQNLSPQSQVIVERHIPIQVQQGLGGYWTLNENNERVWCQTSNDGRHSSLDRKLQMQKVKSTSSPNITVSF